MGSSLVKIRRVTQKMKWGIMPHESVAGHFHTGYVPFADDERMEVGTNVIITGHLGIDAMKRGRSAANMIGHFMGHHEAKYVLSMSSVLDLLVGLQGELITVDHGYFVGEWTFVKQGSDIFLKPYYGD